MGNIMSSILLVLVGLIVGIIVMFIFNLIRKNTATNKADKILEKARIEGERIKKDYIAEAKNEAKKLNDFLRQLTTNNEWQDITVMQAAPSALYRLQGRWRWNIVLKSSGENQVRNLSTLWQYVSLKIKTKDTRISFRLDPA